MTYKPIIFYWRKPKVPVFVSCPKFRRTEEILKIRGIQFLGRWFIGVYTLAPWKEDRP